RKNTGISRLTRFAPIHRRGRATADALQAVGFAGVVLPIVAQGTHRVGGDDIAPPPSQGWSEHPGAGHDAPMVWDLGPNRHVAAGQPHPLMTTHMILGFGRFRYARPRPHRPPADPTRLAQDR